MTASFEVTCGTPDDAAAVLALERTILEEGGSFATAPDEFHLSEAKLRVLLASLLEQPDGRFLVAREGGRILGVLLVHQEPVRALRHVGRLELFVDPGSRRRGVGDALLAEAVRRAELDPGLCKLSLAVFADNVAALALYRRHGFREEGHRVGEYLMDDGTLRDDLLLWRSVGR
ncbi:MAG: GNAT family N-acetyltransferase [Deltaproteobacteria bacterium]|nr:GNAT family N-acetyltransferase [Deltaproteobacteria bacterium]